MKVRLMARPMKAQLSRRLVRIIVVVAVVEEVTASAEAVAVDPPRP